MKRFLQYGRHLLRSKGRHGTHSPFVYAFVEQVMRSRSAAPVVQDGGLSRHEAKLLFRMLRYMQPQMVCVPATCRPAVHQLITAATGADILPFLPENKDKMYAFKGHVLVVMPDEGPDVIAGYFPHAARLSLVYLQPHADADKAALWTEALASGTIQMSIDLWYWGLIVKDDSFKARQHFRLR